MNEGLELEIERYIIEHYEAEDLSLHDKDEIESIAEHFYNLALADVREMVARQQEANHNGTDEWIRAKAIAYESICDFIDNLTK